MSDDVPAVGETNDRPLTDADGAGPTWEAFHALETRLEQRAVRRDGWTLFMFAFAAVAVIFSIIGIGLGSRAIDESKRNVRSAASQAPPVTTSSTPAGGGSSACPPNDGLAGNVADHGARPAGGTGVAVEAGDFFFGPTCVTDAPAGTITLTVHNGGQALHNVSIPDQAIDTDVEAGQTITVAVKVGSGPVPYFCKYHRTSGMVGSVVPGGG